MLRVRLLASERQLESKISEAGPTDQRCDPHVITEARKLLLAEGKIEKLNGPRNTVFFYRPDTFDQDNPRDFARMNQIFAEYEEFRLMTSSQELCGHAFERLVESAANQAGGYFHTGAVGHPVLRFGNVLLPGALDLILNRLIGAQFTTLVEAKNIREWIYPSAEEVWGLINKSLHYLDVGPPVIPILAARKIQYSTRILFKKIGILGVETHRQYFNPSLVEQLAPIKHKDGLGFHDITCETEPPDWLVRFFREVIPKQAQACDAKFRAHANVLKAYAPDLGRSSSRNRLSLWHEFCREVGMSTDYDEFDDNHDE